MERGDEVIDIQGRTGIILLVDEECPTDYRVVVNFGVYTERLKMSTLKKIAPSEAVELVSAKIAGLIIVTVAALTAGFAVVGVIQVWRLIVR